MCAEIAINAGQNAYFGRQLLEIDPNLAQTFRQFDSSSWQLLYLYPRWLSPDMYSAKDRLVEALTLYFNAPAEKKTDAAWITKYLEQEMRYLGFDSREMATLMMLQYWGMNTNVHKACFWMLSYMLHEPGLLGAIREETASAFVDNRLDPQKLENSCPQLEALWLEVIRLTVSASSVRYITKDVTIGGKRLQSGNILINSCRQLHFNEAVFGKSPDDFDPNRFLKMKGLQQSRSWKPFGGGVSLCPGRFIAKRAVCMFIAHVLRRYDVELAYPQPFPKGNDKNPDLGVFVPDRDLV
ncbi:MAG: hypothetical protein Q9204_006802, partial [Flavoplaca sp. TL-2023a]